MRLWIAFFFCAALVIDAASAQNTPPLSVPPRSKGAPHICRDYPPRAAMERREGGDELLFDITTEGTVDALIVAASSGSLDLDQAAARCAKQWQYEPAQSDGKPVEVSNVVEVAWSVSGPQEWPLPGLLSPATNCLKAHPDAAKREASSLGISPTETVMAPGTTRGTTVVGYQLSNGEVSRTSLLVSSGDATLDSYALSCVNSWRFRAVYSNGEPANGTHAAVIDWTGTTLK